MSRLAFALSSLLVLGLVGCDDDSKCVNFCNQVEACGLGSAAACTTDCQADLQRTEDDCGDADECPCNEESGDYILCQAFASCEELQAGTACQTELAESLQACLGPDEETR